MSQLIAFAHRGASGYEPENTLRAIRKALELGAAWVEVDVFAVEGELVVIHDDRLERTTNGRGLVVEHSLADLRALDAGYGESIPLLREVLDLLGDRAGINIELKGPRTGRPLVSLLEYYMTCRGWTHERLLVSSFDLGELQAVKALQPDLHLGLLSAGLSRTLVRRAVSLGAYSVHIGLRSVSREFVATAHAAKLKVFVYTVNKVQDIRRLRNWGVDGVFTDYPELMATS